MAKSKERRQNIILDGGVNIAYYSYHDDQSPTIVMIHGITGNHKGFQYLVPELADYRLIIPDLPGFGDSDLPSRSAWSIDGLAALANQFVAKLNLVVPPIILGHSMGGLVVASQIAQNPELYAKTAILISPVPTAVRGLDSRQIGAKLGALQYKLGYTTGKFGDQLIRSNLIADGMTILLSKTRNRKRRQAIYSHHRDNLRYFSSSEFYYQLHRDINRHGAIDYADALKSKKVLLITGNRDSVTPLREEKKLARAINAAEFHIIPEVGHLIHYEKPTEAAALIREFLN